MAFQIYNKSRSAPLPTKNFVTIEESPYDIPLTHDIVYMTIGEGASQVNLPNGYSGQRLTLVKSGDTVNITGSFLSNGGGTPALSYIAGSGLRTELIYEGGWIIRSTEATFALP